MSSGYVLIFLIAGLVVTWIGIAIAKALGK